MTLYEINKEIENILENSIDQETGEIIGDLSGLDALNMERDQKIENIALMIKNLRADAKALKDEADALTKRRRTAENRAEWLFNYLANMLQGERFKSPKTAISWRKSQSVEITNKQDLPLEFLRIKDPEPNKTLIKDALRAGKTVSGAVLVDNLSMSIK